MDVRNEDKVSNEDKVRIMTCANEGAIIQCKELTGGSWHSTNDPKWDWSMNTYRVKPVVKNIIIQNMDVHQIELVRKAMETTGKGAASKAIFQILSEHQRLRRDVFNLEKELALFNGCNKESKKVIGNKEK